jgi:hypothetical protein
MWFMGLPKKPVALRSPEVIDADADRMLIDALVDGSLFRTLCPHGQSEIDLDFPVLVFFPDRALPIWFLTAQATDSEQDSADFRRLLARFRAARPDDWDEAWWQLFWATGRTEFSEVALQRRSFPAAGRALPQLLSDQVQQLLNEIVDQHWLRRDEGGASDFEDDRALLQSCREIGTEVTLSDLATMPN